jgi:Cu+-exporting ATPase
MHPQVRRDGPGVCPICGMSLEPVIAPAISAPNADLVDMTRRFWVGLALTAPLFAMEMAGHLFGFMLPIGRQSQNWVELALATPVVAWAGLPFFKRAWMSLTERHANMFTLVALGVGAAWLYSFVAMFDPRLFPQAELGGHAPLYFESAAVITVLVLLGQVLELRARAQTSGAIRALMHLAPTSGRRVRDDGVDEDVALALVQVGDRLRVRPGEKIPVDGQVIEGRVSVDESLVTGESMPVTKQPGDKVIAGALNLTGSFVMRAEKIGADTLLARIAKMVSDAQRSRAPIQRLADQVAGWFVPAVIGVAFVTFVAWMIAGPEPRLAHALMAAVSVLIIACPCALGLATPMSIMVGVGRGAQAGVLIRDAEALERLGRIDTLVIDKTGTLTEGRPALTQCVTADGVAADDLLRLAASLERGSEHPLGGALLRAAHERNIVLAEPTEVVSPVGKGLIGVVEGRSVMLGGERLMLEHGVELGQLKRDAETLQATGASVIFAVVDGRAIGLLAVADPIKATTPEAVRVLQADGVRLIMMTGDNRITAQSVAKQIGIVQVESGVLPEDKARLVQTLRAAGRSVAMAGDGVNDAPALAAAEVGVAMGGGSDVAIESAGVTLLHGDLAGLVRARRLSRLVMGNIRQNLGFAFVYNVAGIPLAAGALYPMFGWLLSPQIAAAAMALSSVSVIANALRLRVVRL